MAIPRANRNGENFLIFNDFFNLNDLSGSNLPPVENRSEGEKCGISILGVAGVLAGLALCASMVMVSVLLFEQTRDRIYSDFEYRVSTLESQVNSIQNVLPKVPGQ